MLLSIECSLQLTEISASPWRTKCSAVVTVSSARTTPSCTDSPFTSLHFWMRDTTCRQEMSRSCKDCVQSLQNSTCC